MTVGNDTVVTEYVLHGKNIVHMTRGSDNLHFLYDVQGRPAEVIYNGTAYRYLYNLQGDVVSLVDGSGRRLWSTVMMPGVNESVSRGQWQTLWGLYSRTDIAGMCSMRRLIYIISEVDIINIG